MLKPNEQIVTSAAVAAAVYAIFQVNAPNLADVKASAPGGPASLNTFKSVKMATYTSVALVAGLGILAKDPTIYIVGGLVVVAEAWKFHHANATHQMAGNGNAVVAPGSQMTGQAAPVLSGGA